MIWPELAAEWRLTPAMRDAYDRRESGACPACRNNYRNRQLARAIVHVFGGRRDTSLAKLVRSAPFRSLRILSIDMQPYLGMLDECPGHERSDYITSLVPARSAPDRGLPFPDARFDLVVASDTLEHVPDPRRPLAEIRRVLRPGGRFITAQPVILTRPTVVRAVVNDRRQVEHLLEPSYHGRGADDSLVFFEFGADFLDDLRGADLEPAIYFYNLPADDYAWIAVCTTGRGVTARASMQARPHRSPS